jgi:hypothetical protein
MSFLRALMLLVWLATPGIGSAQAFRIDDSASVVESRSVRMRWKDPAPGIDHRAGATLVVHARLDVAAWRGTHARVFLTLPLGAAAPVTARWETRGRLLPGAIRSGERALVYAGPIDSSTLEDTLALVLEADGRDLVRNEQLNFHFEIEPERP